MNLISRLLLASTTNAVSIQHKVAGLPITIEHPKGSLRKLHNDDGKIVYSRHMYDHYGFFNNTKGRDGDEVDVIVGPLKDPKEVYVVHMIDKGPDVDQREDEDKVMLGFPSSDAAKSAFIRQYAPDFFGGMTTLPISEFKSKLATAQLPYRKKKITATNVFKPRSVGPTTCFAAKVTPKAVNYTPNASPSSKELCNKCAHFRKGNRCEVLRMVVSPVGWCKLFLADQLKGAAEQCPKCKSSKYSLMPTDFETAKCSNCGKTWQVKNPPKP